MNTRMVEEIANAVLYEGYLLYPYRASAIKNRQRWNFGVLYPRAYAEQQSGADAWRSQTECLIRAGADAKLNVRVRFLHLAEPVPALTLGATPPTTSVNAMSARERDFAVLSLHLSELAFHPSSLQIRIPPLAGQQALEAKIKITAEALDGVLFKIHVSIANTGAFNGSTRDQALLESLISTHTILNVEGGEFVSLLDPPEDLREAAGACQNIGTWPVLVGEQGQRDAMLSSPIILYDYPEIAPESPGALFDGTEIDEILTLRILTLTDQEKLEMGRTDERARQILERTEAMPPEQFMKMHGVLRGLRDVSAEVPEKELP